MNDQFSEDERRACGLNGQCIRDVSLFLSEDWSSGAFSGRCLHLGRDDFFLVVSLSDWFFFECFSFG